MYKLIGECNTDDDTAKYNDTPKLFVQSNNHVGIP